MGQYYRVYIKSDACESVLEPVHDGLKLMEQAYVTSGITNAVMTGLFHKRSKVAWVGDYTDPDECRRRGFRKSRVWGGDAKVVKQDLCWFTCRYIINHSKYVYIDYYDYLLQASRQITKDYEWIIHPLPLLTAMGNGNGDDGGGYYNTLPDFDKVGVWAGDTLETSNEIPKFYLPNGHTVDYPVYQPLFREG